MESQILNACAGRDFQNNYQQQTNNTIPPPLPPFRQSCQNKSMTGNTTTQNDTNAIRKYLVLLQDCLAIKFVPLVANQQSHQFTFAFNGVAGNRCSNTCHHPDDGISCGSTGVDQEDLSLNCRNNHLSFNGGGSSNGSANNNYERYEMNSTNNRDGGLSSRPDIGASCSHQHNHFTLGSNNANIHDNENPQQAFHQKPCHHQNQKQNSHLRHHNFRSPHLLNSGGALNRLSTSITNGKGGNLNSAEVDHSLHAMYLYKGFQEANLQCHWNVALSETFRNIQYKGYIVPSTILVGALPKFLSILRSAWSRQMLRSPTGYRIEFIGEIEEVIADPIQKGQFAPLSDSLCWAILELTSMGQEAFVDSIMSALQLAFPAMSCPSRELVFQTLEKLIRERKVYQTSRGYFVVTPEIFRYMVSANFHEFDGIAQFGNEQTTPESLQQPMCPRDNLNLSRQSWESATDQNRCSFTANVEEDLIEVVPSPKLKRHNSLKLIRQKDVALTQVTGSSGQRRHSLRLPKSKSCGRMNDPAVDDDEVKRTKVKSSTIEHISRAMRSLRTATMLSSSSNNEGGTNAEGEKHKKNKSLLSKLFPFRRSTSKSRNDKSSTAPTTPSSAACRDSICSESSASTITEASSGSENKSTTPTKTKHSESDKESTKFTSTQTQTTNSTEQLCKPSVSSPSKCSLLVTDTNNVEHSHSGKQNSESATNRTSSADMILSTDCIRNENSHQTRSSSRRSMSILDDSPLYDVLQDVAPTSTCGLNQISPNFQVGCPVAPPTFPGFQHHHNPVQGESSRCSTLSSQAASSLGYCSQGHPSMSGNYSPNLDIGLVPYNCYPGDGSIASSHSPCGYGYGNNGNQPFPQPPKPNAYSSARYKNSYEWYKKRYPNYISPAAGRNSPLYASLTAPRSKSRSRPTYESLLSPANNGRNGDALLQMTEKARKRASLCSPNELPSNIGKFEELTSSNAHQKGLTKQGKSAANTTTVTQAVKSTTNMELELLLPLGKIMKAALQAKRDAIKDAWLRDELGSGYAAYVNRNKPSHNNSANENSNKNSESNSCNDLLTDKNGSSIKINLDNTGAKLRVGEPTTKTEVTTVVNNNGVIETHFDSSAGINQPDFTVPNMQSNVAIKTVGGVTNVVFVDGKSGEKTKPTGSDEERQHNIQPQNTLSKQQPVYNQYNSDHQLEFTSKSADQTNSRRSFEKLSDKRSTSSCVKIIDIGKDCAADKEIIKVY